MSILLSTIAVIVSVFIAGLLSFQPHSLFYNLNHTCAMFPSKSNAPDVYLHPRKLLQNPVYTVHT